jgi:hypothetical protein
LITASRNHDGRTRVPPYCIAVNRAARSRYCPANLIKATRYNGDGCTSQVNRGGSRGGGRIAHQTVHYLQVID